MINKKSLQNLTGSGKIGHDGSNAGRPPEWLKAKCVEIVNKKKLIDFLGDVAAGDLVEEKIDIEGNKIKCSASVKDRMKAVEMLLDRGFGKCVQPIGDGQDGLSEIIKTIIVRPK